MSDTLPPPEPSAAGSAEVRESLTSIFRVIDANLNRAAEGLRVTEDVFRFVLEDGYHASGLKQVRHQLVEAAACWQRRDLLASRDAVSDPGRGTEGANEYRRADCQAILEANFNRVCQSFRVLEEISKLPTPAAASVGDAVDEPERTPAIGNAKHWERLRYEVYQLQKSALQTIVNQHRLGNYRLCVMIDAAEDAVSFGNRLTPLLQPGVLIQLRDKQASTATLVERCGVVRDRMAAYRKSHPECTAPPLWVINDRVDLAAACDSDGVHLGQEDLPPAAARSMLGPRKLIGISTHNLEELHGAIAAGANYIGAGQVFNSRTKDTGRLAGLAYLREVAQTSRLPAFAIGGIDRENLNEVLQTGVHGVAVATAVSAAVDPQATVREFLNRLNRKPPADSCG